ncbi:MAG: carboxypeptidase regulatory-like domain-containing protein [Vicinamibacterales bacterium]
MRLHLRSGRLGLVLLLLALAVPAAAQDFRGRITGTVKDSSGAVLPGVTVTATSPALIQPQVAVTTEDGQFRLIALPAGTYEVTFELTGFKTLKRAEIRVVIAQTLSLNETLDVATLQETVTVSGESPVVDTTTTTVGTNFTKELLTEIPNARDIWAAMAQAPGFTVTGYDVGGSHTGTQTGYVTYGISQQNTTKIEGVNTTEGASANAGYFDFGSFEEFQVGGSGNNAEQDVPGASLNITVKSGGDRLSADVYQDWEGKGLITDNVPDAFKVANQRDENGFFRRTPLTRGNPIDHQYDFNYNVGGPIWRGKAWFFWSHRINDQFKTTLGFDGLAESKLTNYTVKGTYQLSRSNQLIGFFNKREKLQPLRELGASRPLSTAYYQASTNYPSKVEWTSVLNNKMFLDVLVAEWRNYFPLRPTSEVGSFPADKLVPGRIDLVTNNYFDGGAMDYYQNQQRFKPQWTASLTYFKEGLHGSHDLKFGYEGRRERQILGQDQPFDIFYRDRSGATSELDIYNTPVAPVNQVWYNAGYVSDVWKFNNHLTFNLGLRAERYVDGWPSQNQTPNQSAYFKAVNVPATTVASTNTIAPRAGFAYDLRSNGKSVVKGFYGRYYFNSADIIANQQNPVGAAQLRYQFNDLNGNRLLDGPQELGRLLTTVGGAGFVRVDPNIKRPYGDEVSAHFEQEVAEGLSARVSYVYKNLRNDWGEVDLARVNAYTITRTLVDPGIDGVTGTADDGSITLLDRPADVGSDRVWTNPEGFDSDYNTVEVALNRRFRNGWMLLTSFGHTWFKEFYNQTSSTSATGAAGNSKVSPYDWRPNYTRFGQEPTTQWNYKLVGRYTLPWQIGFSGSYKLQSGRQWGRSLSVALPGAGSETVRVEPVNSNRAPNVHIADIRFDKSFKLPGRYGRLVGMMDVFNIANLDTVTTFRTATAASFKEVTALLDPRIIRFGVRYEF